MPKVFAFRHVAFETLGLLEPLLQARGHDVTYLEMGWDDPAAADNADLLVVLGGPIGAYEGMFYPFIAPELAAIERRLKAQRPTIGLCLGAQMMALALGAKVYPGPAGKEIGWGALSLAASASNHPLQHLAPGKTRVLHWHGDTFDLPPGATLLASSPLYAHQAYALGSFGLATQFHAEVTARDMERWLIGHACEIAATPGVDIPALRSDTARYAPDCEAAGRRMFGSWLEANAL